MILSVHIWIQLWFLSSHPDDLINREFSTDGQINREFSADLLYGCELDTSRTGEDAVNETHDTSNYGSCAVSETAWRPSERVFYVHILSIPNPPRALLCRYQTRASRRLVVRRAREVLNGGDSPRGTIWTRLRILTFPLVVYSIVSFPLTSVLTLRSNRVVQWLRVMSARTSSGADCLIPKNLRDLESELKLSFIMSNFLTS